MSYSSLMNTKKVNTVAIRPRKNLERRRKKEMIYKPLNQVETARRVDDARDLARLQGEGGVLKLLLHVTPSKVSQVAPLTRAAAVGLGQGQLAQGDLALLDALLVGLDDGVGLALAACDLGLWFWSVRQHFSFRPPSKEQLPHCMCVDLPPSSSPAVGSRCA